MAEDEDAGFDVDATKFKRFREQLLRTWMLRLDVWLGFGARRRASWWWAGGSGP